MLHQVQHRPAALAGLLAVVCILVRLPQLGWGLPEIEEEALPMKKAFEMWGWDEGRVAWIPRPPDGLP